MYETARLLLLNYFAFCCSSIEMLYKSKEFFRSVYSRKFEYLLGLANLFSKCLIQIYSHKNFSDKATQLKKTVFLCDVERLIAIFSDR